jgi:hypothetical protein
MMCEPIGAVSPSEPCRLGVSNAVEVVVVERSLVADVKLPKLVRPSSSLLLKPKPLLHPPLLEAGRTTLLSPKHIVCLLLGGESLNALGVGGLVDGAVEQVESSSRLEDERLEEDL